MTGGAKTASGLLVCVLFFGVPPASAEIDPSFGDMGVAAVSVTDANGGSDAVVVETLSDGGLVVVTREGAGDLAVFRFEVDGVLDATFGAGGKVTVDLGGDDLPADVVVQPDGAILIACVSRFNGSDRLGLVRILADGGLDPGFGTTGVVIENFDVHTNAQRLGLGSGGEIFVAGEIRSCCPRGFPGPGAFVAKFRVDGTLDPAFASAGVFTRPGSASFGDLFFGLAFYAMQLQPDGKIVTAGLDYVAETQGSSYSGSWAVHRLRSDGSPDPDFGTGGVAYVWLPWESNGASLGAPDARDLSVLPDGSILVGGGNGLADFRSSDAFFSARFTPEGSLDASFGSDGLLEFRPYPRPLLWPIFPDPARASARHLLRRSDGSWFLVGVGTPDASAPTESALVVRYLADGSLDETWSDDGLLEIAGFPVWISVDAALDGDENVILATRSEGRVELRRLLGYEPCGDGVLNPWEECDDGNLAPGDCCSADCSLEPAGDPCVDDGNGCTSDTCDGAGSCEHEQLPDSEACDDGDLCTQDDACFSGVCVGESRAAAQCREGGTGSLVLRSRGGSRDLLSWSWKKGEATEISEIVPQTYALCVYGEAGANLIASLDIPGLPCGPDHCYKANSRKTVYSSKGAAFDGVRKLVLGAGVEGKALARLKAQGERVSMPGLPLVAPVVAQLHGENGLCLGASYSSPSRNRAGLFKGKAD